MLGRQSSQIGAIVGQLDDYGVSLLLQSMNPMNCTPAWLQAPGNPNYGRMFPGAKQNSRIPPESTGRIVAAVANLVDAVAEAGAPALGVSGQSEAMMPQQHPGNLPGPFHSLSAGLSTQDWRHIPQSNGIQLNRLMPSSTVSIPTTATGVHPCSDTMRELQATTVRNTNSNQALVPGWEQGGEFPWMSCGFSPTTCPPISGSNTTSTSCLPQAGDQSCVGYDGSKQKTSNSTPSSSERATPLIPINVDNISSNAAKKTNQQKISNWSSESNSLLGLCHRYSGGSR